MTTVDINTKELKENAPIIPYIEKFYKDKINITKRGGKMVFAKCIFHEEDTASLAIYENGTYKCFGCGEHGDIITLVQKLENVDFQSACIIIANNVGYKLDFIQTNPVIESYKDNLDEFSRRYWINLQHNGDAYNYITNIRKISPEMIDRFRLGLTDNEEYKYRKDLNNISNRIAFPILEHKRINPKCVGMAYRSIKDVKPKYINDHNQDGRNGQNPTLSGVFIKGNLLYGLAQAYDSISSNNFAFVVEGYFDVISMHQSGFENTVGIMGTSFTDEQINALSKVTKNVFLILDGDEAGEKAIKRYIPALAKHGLSVMVCMLKGFKDPDEMCKHFNHDYNKIYGYINNHMQNGIYNLIFTELSIYKQNILNEKICALNRIQPILESISDPVVRSVYLKQIEKELS